MAECQGGLVSLHHNTHNLFKCLKQARYYVLRNTASAVKLALVFSLLL